MDFKQNNSQKGVYTMIIIMKPNSSDDQVKRVTDLIESKGLTPHLSKGSRLPSWEW